MTTPDLVTIPVISMWQPWAQWVSLGWKDIESRLHERFAKLAGKRIGIHASLKWDNDAIRLASPYLSAERIEQTKRFLRIGGAIICTTCVTDHRLLTQEDEHRALIECSTRRWGLTLAYTKVIEAIPCKGRQGIWYQEVPSRDHT